MNIKIIFFVVIFLSNLAVKAQTNNTPLTFKGDTSAYIIQLAEQKSQYLDKSIDNLLATLKLPVKHYAPGRSATVINADIKSVSIEFYTSQQMDAFTRQHIRIPIGITILFTPNIPLAKVVSVEKKYPFASIRGLTELFGQCLITDIKAVK